MKKILLLGALIATVGAFAGDPNVGGTVFFKNKVIADNIDAYAYSLSIGDSAAGKAAIGAAFFAQLYAGPTADSLTAVATPVHFVAAGGYFNGGEVAIPTVGQNKTAFFQVKVWDGSTGAATFEAYKGQMWGVSNISSTTTGGNDVAPPATAGNMLGLQKIAVGQVPEPSTIALGLLGAAALLLRRRS